MAERQALYLPEVAPDDPTVLAEFLNREFARVSIAILLIAAGSVEETFVVPAKPRTGMLRLADGTSWNPGAGRGVYYYDENSSSWIKL